MNDLTKSNSPEMSQTEENSPFVHGYKVQPKTHSVPYKAGGDWILFDFIPDETCVEKPFAGCRKRAAEYLKHLHLQSPDGKEN